MKAHENVLMLVIISLGFGIIWNAPVVLTIAFCVAVIYSIARIPTELDELKKVGK